MLKRQWKFLTNFQNDVISGPVPTAGVVFAKAGRGRCYYQQQFGPDIRFPALVLNFNKIFLLGICIGLDVQFTTINKS